MLNRQAPCTVRGLLRLALAGLVMTAAVWPLRGERLIVRQQAEFVVPVQQAQGTAPDANSDYPYGAPLPTDSEVDRVLKRADEYVQAGRFDLAVVVWQKVLDENKSVVRTQDGRLFRSVQVYIEEQLAQLARQKPQALREYRIKADGEARALLAASQNSADPERALADVVRRYFFSALGDDAAYELGCLMLDRFEFVAAGRLFEKVLSLHPDYMSATGEAPSVARADLLLRLAVANARAGDPAAARANLDELSQLGEAAVSRQLLAAVRRDLAEARDVNVAAAEGDWTMAHGTPARDGRMPGLADADHHKADWDALWRVQLDDQFGGDVTGGVSPAAGRFALQEKWLQNGWLPAHRLLLYKGRAFLRADKSVRSVDGRTGKLQWLREAAQVQFQNQNNNLSGRQEVVLFADRASSAMAIHDGVLYYLEDDAGRTTSSNSRIEKHHNITAYSPRYANQIVAVDAVTGKLLWTQGVEPDEHGNRPAVRYVGAPAQYGNLLLITALDNDALWLYARYAERHRKGELAWRVELCSAPPGGPSYWIPPAVAVAGGDAYIVTGSGVVLNVDASSGQIRWAVRYRRGFNSAMPLNANNNNNYTAEPAGFHESFAAATGRRLIVAPADADELFALDRRTGRLLWYSPRFEATHVLGLMGRSLFVAGHNVLRRYDVVTGSLVDESQEAVGEDRTISGRGFVTADAVYVPVGNSVARVDPMNLRRKLSHVQVNIMPPTQTNAEPVGNIYSDGHRVYGVGLDRVYAVIDRRQEPDPLGQGVGGSDRPSDDRAASNGVELLAAHGVSPTAESLGRFLRQMHPSDEMRRKVDALIEQLGDDDFHMREQAKQELLRMPLAPIEALTRASQDPDAERSTRAQKVLDATSGQQTRLLLTALKVIVQRRVKGLSAQTLAAVPLCGQRYLLHAARDALAATVEPADGDMLRQALRHESKHMRLVAATALGVALGGKAVDDLKRLFDDPDDEVKLAAAAALANIGQRDSLTMLADLLLSDDLNVRLGAIQALRSFTRQHFGFVPYEEHNRRALAVAQWRKWIADNGASAALHFPLEPGRFLLGRTLVCNYRLNKVYELDAEGKEVWSIPVTNAWGCQGLPNGHRIISSYSQRTVTEYDEKGEVVWRKDNLPSAPFSVQRLDNGNTLVACSNSNRVLEYDPEGKTVWDITIVNRPTSAQRLANGNTLIALQNTNRVVEVDGDGKVVWTLDNVRSPLSATRLENGNTIVAEVGGQAVREFNTQKRQVWASTDIKQTLKSPYHVERLDNGNTLMCDYYGLREVTPGGRVVWERRENGISRFHRY